ncbi:MAG: iron ABC transporter permease [Rhizobiaceae bacterium]|nr:iron ABC transporter permease [Rhizobiaceae bacterium]
MTARALPGKDGGAPPVRTVAPGRNYGALAPALVAAAIALLPIAVVVGIALSGDGSDWPHLVRNVLPQATGATLLLLVLVAAGTASIGVTSAWMVVAYDFPFRKVLAWVLVLPLAVPPYLAAYAFAEFLHFSGPVQSTFRALTGHVSPRDYWFPEIRSTYGAAIVLSMVLYPYVYLTSRVVFIMQGRHIGDAARTLGAAPLKVLWAVLLPVARPAIVAGVALVLMETLNDIGASKYLGVPTLTYSVYTTWLNRGSLEGAAQIAVLMLIIVFAVLMMEKWARRQQRFHVGRGSQMNARPPRVKLTGARAALATLATTAPVVCGFGIPLYVFGDYASRRLYQLTEPDLLDALFNSVVVAASAAIITVFVALLLIHAARLDKSRPVAAVTRLAMIGYALPGTVLGLGLLFTLAFIDNSIDAWMRDMFGVSTGLIFTGSAAAVVLVCSIRFLALAEGAVRGGIEKLPPHIDEAARSLGRSPTRSATSVLLPLLRPAVFTAAVLVFVDTVKELSATILLRPFGFNTLATSVFEDASRGVPEDGAMAALAIIATAIIPVVLLSGALTRDRDANL